MSHRRRYEIMMEVARLRAVLFEDRIDFFRKNYVPRIIKMLPLDIPLGDLPEWWISGIKGKSEEEMDQARGEWVMQKIIAADPDRTKKHAQWLLNLFVRGSLQWEDLAIASHVLTQFMEKKKDRTIPRDTDLGRFRSVGELNATINQSQQALVQAQDNEEQQDRQKAMAESAIILNNSKWLVVSPQTKFAACYWGRPTDWCTAYGDPKGKHPSFTHNQFDYYTKSHGPLYIAIDLQAEAAGQTARWQFSPGAGQFMNHFDRPISISQWLEENPEPAEALGTYANRSAKDVTDKLPFQLPAFKNTPRRLYITQDGFEIKAPLFYAKPDFAIRVDEAKNIQRVVGSWLGDDDDLIWLLNRLKYRGSIRGFSQTHRPIFWSETKGWGKFKDVAETVIQFEDGYRWAEAKDIGENMRVVLFTPDDAERLIGAISDNGEFTLRPIPSRSGISYNALLPHLAKLVTDDPRITSWPNARSYGYNERIINIDNLPEEQLRRAVEKKPSLASFTVLLKINGPTDEVRSKITTAFEEAGGDEIEWVEADGKWYALAEEESDAHAAAESWGTSEFKEFSELINGGFAEWDHTGESAINDAGDFLSDLTKDATKDDMILLRKIGVAVWQELDDDQKREVLDEINDLYDPAKVEHIEAAIEVAGEIDWLESAVLSSVADGERHGAEAEAMKAFEEAFDHPYIFFKTNDGWSREFRWDTPVGMLIPIAEVAKAADEEDWQPDWMGNTDTKFEHNQPQYGFQDYDEEAAMEAFTDHIHDRMPDVDENAQIEYPPDEDEEDEEDEDTDEEAEDDPDYLRST